MLIDDNNWALGIASDPEKAASMGLQRELWLGFWRKT